MAEILIHDAGVTPRGMRFLDVRILFRKGAGKLSWEIANAIEQELNQLKQLKKERGTHYEFLIDAFSSWRVGVECPPDPYTKRRIIRAVKAIAKSHHMEVEIIAFP